MVEFRWYEDEKGEEGGCKGFGIMIVSFSLSLYPGPGGILCGLSKAAKAGSTVSRLRTRVSLCLAIGNSSSSSKISESSASISTTLALASLSQSLAT